MKKTSQTNKENTNQTKLENSPNINISEAIKTYFKQTKNETLQALLFLQQNIFLSAVFDSFL